MKRFKLLKEKLQDIQTNLKILKNKYSNISSDEQEYYLNDLRKDVNKVVWDLRKSFCESDIAYYEEDKIGMVQPLVLLVSDLLNEPEYSFSLYKLFLELVGQFSFLLNDFVSKLLNEKYLSK
ncbi:hypothetical protein [Metamycoplasma auris]|uniref:Uncharacterized protein n=1 Tax=Metamycoplasma auris TaxID=51363 RepID=A0A2W7FTK7_9BACT|nr:hypothetical protein [Metamycoplasma auris]PZV97709.1 hypothetical protein BCF89_1373 [Metamycoplasma auris]